MKQERQWGEQRGQNPEWVRVHRSQRVSGGLVFIKELGVTTQLGQRRSVMGPGAGRWVRAG